MLRNNLFSRRNKNKKKMQPKMFEILISEGWYPNIMTNDEIVKESKQRLYNWKKKLDYKGI